MMLEYLCLILSFLREFILPVPLKEVYFLSLEETLKKVDKQTGS